jgi:hypothetical protein
MDGVFKRFKKAMPGTDRITFNEYLEKPHIGLEGIMGTITSYERQMEKVNRLHQQREQTAVY